MKQSSFGLTRNKEITWCVYSGHENLAFIYGQC